METEGKKLNIVRKGVMVKKVVEVIPEQTITKEVEVDTLQEFLAEIGLNEDQLRVAVKSYLDDKVTQPSYNMDDILAKVSAGKKAADKYLTGVETRLELADNYIVDALVASKKWLCTGKVSSTKKYVLERL